MSIQMKPIKQLKQFHAENIAPVCGTPIGAPESAVIEVEQTLGITLPADYREYLLWFGWDRYGILRGSDCFVEHVVSNTRTLPELLKGNGLSHELPPRFVCPFMHQGYIGTWFEIPTVEDDPKAYFFNEGEHFMGIQSHGTIIEHFYLDIRGLHEST
jgi:hypothetical protein